MDDKTRDALRQAMRDMDGASTLLLALMEYDSTSPELTHAIEIVADRLTDATDRICEVL